jgi:hypothetical protein
MLIALVPQLALLVLLLQLVEQVMLQQLVVVQK